jgi:membrane-associated phospholipid phosphatase
VTSTLGRAVVTAGIGAGLLAGAWYGLSTEPVRQADVRLGDALRGAGSPSVDRAVTLTTDLGSVYAVFGMAGALAVCGRRALAAEVLSLGAVTWAVSQATKTGVRRQRPYEAEGTRRLVNPPTGSSFPSGHAAVGMAVMTVVADRASRPATAALVRAVGAYVAASRVYVGVHYPTDVVGGAGMGLALGSAWRGPVAAAGRGGVAVTWFATRRLAGPVGAVLAWAGLGRTPRALRRARREP